MGSKITLSSFGFVKFLELNPRWPNACSALNCFNFFKQVLKKTDISMN
jgi:hypothetical protein